MWPRARTQLLSFGRRELLISTFKKKSTLQPLCRLAFNSTLYMSCSSPFDPVIIFILILDRARRGESGINQCSAFQNRCSFNPNGDCLMKPASWWYMTTQLLNVMPISILSLTSHGLIGYWIFLIVDTIWVKKLYTEIIPCLGSALSGKR